ncbi:MAG: hypothetical protein Kow0042_06720 [Calditrichia bacterium]
MKKFVKSVILLIGLMILIQCRDQKRSDVREEVLATVDGQSLTLEAFRSFYEVDPNFAVDSVGYRALLEELHKCIDHLRAERMAEKEGVFRQPAFQKAVAWEKNQAMLRQLYREVVEGRVEISEAELREAFQKNNIQVHVRHLFSRDSLQAHRWRKQLLQGASFRDLAKESFRDSVLAGNGGDLGWVPLGDLEEDFADAVARLGKDQISQPMRTRWGFHIIQLLDRREEMILSESEFHRQREALVKKVKRQKSRALAREFIADFIGNLNPQPVPETLRLLWSAITFAEEKNQPAASAYILHDGLVQQIENRLGQELDAPLIRHRQGEISLKEYLEELRNIPESNRPRFRTPKQLSNKIGVWVRDKFLLAEARRRGLEKNSRVLQEVQEFTREQSYGYFLNHVVDTLQVPRKVGEYFQKRDREILKLYPSLERFHTLQQWKWWTAERHLRHWLRAGGVNIEINTALLRQENRRIDWRNRIPMIIIRKPA